MPVEVCSYRLTIRGKPVGSQLLRTLPGRRHIELEAKLMLQGMLGQQVVTQTSLLHASSLVSLRFSELLVDKQEKRRYDVTFDEASGLVRASSGSKDAAEVPYSRPYQDPLGLLYLLRRLGEDQTSLRVPMLGKDVVIERLPNAGLKTALGDRVARVYALRPGSSYVYIDAEPPHPILRLSQRLEAGPLDVLIVRISQEQAMPLPESKSERGERSSRRRGRRSGRKRVVKRL